MGGSYQTVVFTAGGSLFIEKKGKWKKFFGRMEKIHSFGVYNVLTSLYKQQANETCRLYTSF
jgi:hypothetical protein